MSEPILEVDDLTINYETRSETITAVSNASFTVESGKYFGLVGESGCGKSTIAQAIIGALDNNGTIASGSIRFKGEEIHEYSDEKFTEEIRWNEIAWIPQGSMESLNPLRKIGKQAVSIAKAHTDYTKEEALDKFKEMLNIVGISENRINDYPHQLSGGMQQRVIIAFALFLEPSLIIADEPTTALDVIMQDQIFKYLDKIKEMGGNDMLLITHDISLVFQTCESIAIMHSGQVAETGDTDTIFDDPRHPYSILLQRAFPDIRYPEQELTSIKGYPPQLEEEADFCTFADRCPWVVDECRESAPELDAITQSASNAHKAACFRKGEVNELYQQNNELPTEVE